MAEPKFLICKQCKKIVAVVQDSACPTKCCGEPMEELIAGTTDGAKEKHVPSYKVDGNKVDVVVGEVEHPMLEAHYIQWIAIQTKQGMQRKVLAAGEAPKASFALTDDDELIAVYEYCNLHGLWKA